MSNFYSKVQFAFDCLVKKARGGARVCSHCGHNELHLIDRKMVLAELYECKTCGILFRNPPDSVKENFAFYQRNYDEGFTTEMLGEVNLKKLTDTGFKGHEKDFSVYLEVLAALGVKTGASMIDYGCSWGYGTWQLSKAGFNVQGFEISRPRAEYGCDKLKVDIVQEKNELKSEVDVFFSSHVLEHVPNINSVITLAMSKLKLGGIFIAFTPNGSESYRIRAPKEFRTQWGKVHPSCLTNKFYERIFFKVPLLLMSDPYDKLKISDWNCESFERFDLSGSELCAVAIKTE